MSDPRFQQDDKLLPAALWLAASFVLIAAFFPLPLGYYTFLRIFTCLVCGILAFFSYRSAPRATNWAVVFVLLAVLFNPVVPIHLTKKVWTVLDLGAAAIILAHLVYSYGGLGADMSAVQARSILAGATFF